MTPSQMTKGKSAAVIAAALLAASVAAPAFAQTGDVGQGGFYTGDVAAFRGGPDTLVRMIRDIRLASGDRIVDIRFARQNGLPGYHVVLQHNGRFTFMHITEQNGQVVAIAAASAPDWMLKWNNKAELKWDRRAAVTLSQAIQTAEAANGNAPAIAAGIATSAANPTSDVHAYNVILDMNGVVKRVAVDSQTGAIISDPQALSDWG